MQRYNPVLSSFRDFIYVSMYQQLENLPSVLRKNLSTRDVLE